MSKNIYTIAQFYADYPDDDACLQALFDARYGDEITCEGCGEIGAKFYRVRKRKCYSCASCGYQIYPLSGTIFHRSSTSLRSWLYAMHLFSISKNGVAAKELERHLGVTYKTAYRMAKLIRSLMTQTAQLGGADMIVEADETYIGGRRKRNWYHNKAIVVGAIERHGAVRAQVMSGANVTTILPYLRDIIRPDTTIHTDTSRIYDRLHRIFPHDTVNHKAREYVRGSVYTNTIEGFWSQLKRSLSGTYHSVSKKHLQMYVDEFVFRYNLRGTAIFPILINLAAKPI